MQRYSTLIEDVSEEGCKYENVMASDIGLLRYMVGEMDFPRLKFYNCDEKDKSLVFSETTVRIARVKRFTKDGHTYVKTIDKLAGNYGYLTSCYEVIDES